MIYHFEFNIFPLTKDNEKIMNKQGKFYLSKKNKSYEQELKWLALKQLPKDFKILTKNLTVDIWFFFPDLRRRDVFNYTKSFCDAMTGILWKDDSQIETGRVYKCYLNIPRIILQVQEEQ